MPTQVNYKKPSGSSQGNRERQSSPQSQRKSPYLLRLGTGGQSNNWSTWSETTYNDASLIYGSNVLYMKTGKRFNLPPPEITPELAKALSGEFQTDAIPSSLEEEDIADQMSLGGASIKTSMEELVRRQQVYDYREETKLHLREKHKMRMEEPKIYAYTIERLSNESLAKVRDCPEFETEIELKQDPFKLWLRLQLTHRFGDSLVIPFNIVRAHRAYWNSQQRQDESINAFKKRQDELLKRLQVLDCVVPVPQLQAVHFTLSLDTRRYGQYVSTIENNVARNVEELPATLLDAYVDASNYKVVGVTKEVESTKGSVYQVSQKNASRGDEKSDKKTKAVSSKDTQKANASKSSKGESSSTSSPPGPCPFCTKEGHWQSDCPLKKELIKLRDEPDKKGSINIIVASEPRLQGSVHATSNHVPEVNTDWIMWDTLATDHIFCNPTLVQNIRVATEPIELAGFGNGKMLVNQIADLPGFGSVYFHPDAGVNILSQPTARIRGHSITWLETEGVFIVRDKTNTSELYFSLVNKQYVCMGTPVHLMGSVHVTTVAANKRAYTEREIKEADQAVTFIKRLGYPSEQNAIHAAQSSVNCPVTATHLRRAYDIYGKSMNVIKGKSVSKKPSKIRIERLPTTMNIEHRLELSADIMFVNGLAFLITVSTPLGLTLIHALGRGAGKRTTQAIRTPLLGQLAEYKSKGFHVDHLSVDRDGPIMNLKADLNLQGVTLNEIGAGSHVPHVERKIREVKDHVRSIKPDIPFTLSDLLLQYLVYFAVSRINLMPHTGDAYLHVSPRELFTGRKLNYTLDFRVAFGDFVMLQGRETNNTLAERAEEAIALLPTGNLTGSVVFYALDSGRLVTRDHFTILPMPSRVICKLNLIAGSTATSDGSDQQLDFLYGTNVLTDPTTEPLLDSTESSFLLPNPESVIILADDYVAPPPTAFPQLDQRSDMPASAAEQWSHDFSDNAPVPDLVEEQDEDDDTVYEELFTGETYFEEQHSQVPDLGPNLGMDYTEELDDPKPDETPTSTDTPTVIIGDGHQLRSRARGDRLYFHPNKQTPITKSEYDVLANKRGVILNTMSPKQALKKDPVRAKAAMVAELSKLLEKKSFHPTHRDRSTSKNAKPFWSFMFLKEKFLPSGEPDKLKARLVADGSQQDRSFFAPDPLSVYAPTVSMTILYLMLGIFAKDGMEVTTGDVPSAFLHADLQPETEHVMILDRNTTEIVCELDPSYKPFVRPDGTCLVTLDKALYGLIEAPRLWHDHISKKLVAMGFQQNQIEPCLFYYNQHGIVCYIILYVDDIFVACNRPGFSKLVFEYIDCHYPGIVWKTGLHHSYVGLEINFEVPGQVSLSMRGFINDLLISTNTVGTCKSPAGDHLFTVCAPEEAHYLDKATAKEFHTTVAKLLYLGKRMRYDILVAVSFLCTRVLKPDREDYAKLMHLLKYINHTREQGLCITVEPEMQIVAYIDASYAVHPDFKSHGGMCLTLGSGSILAKSHKIKRNCKSSTEAEFLCASDNLGEALWVYDFLKTIGYTNIPPIIFMEDNTSTIQQILKGRPNSEASRHVSIRFFWICDYIATGEVVIKHCPTADMIADVLTKPLHGEQLRLLRGRLTGARYSNF